MNNRQELANIRQKVVSGMMQPPVGITRKGVMEKYGLICFMLQNATELLKQGREPTTADIDALKTELAKVDKQRGAT